MISQALVPEFDHEMATTRRCLERVPDDKWGWKPHERSMTLGDLAQHIAEMPNWAVPGLKQDSLDLAGYQRTKAANQAELLATFDRHVAAAREAISGSDDANYMKPWALKMGDKELMSMPKIAVVRTFVLNHVIHHRGQLSVYLRENNVLVPSIYGPSADEGQMG